jgi:hypothetical protein
MGSQNLRSEAEETQRMSKKDIRIFQGLLLAIVVMLALNTIVVHGQLDRIGTKVWELSDEVSAVASEVEWVHREIEMARKR